MEIFYLLEQSCNILKLLLKKGHASILKLLGFIGGKLLYELHRTCLRVTVSLSKWLVCKNYSRHWIVRLGLICLCPTSWSDNTDIRLKNWTLFEIMPSFTSFITWLGIYDFLNNFSSLFLNCFSRLRSSVWLCLVWFQTYLVFRLLILRGCNICVVKSELLFVVLWWVNRRIRYYPNLVALVSRHTNQSFPTFKKFASVDGQVV